MRACLLGFLVLVACGGPTAAVGTPGTEVSIADELKVPDDGLKASDFAQPVNKASIQHLQFWLDDAQFEVKWADMLTTPIGFLGGSDSAFHADLAQVTASRFPKGDALCHGDPKFDNFGWINVNGQGVFSDVDFDDSGDCPAVADALRYLVATDLAFGDDGLDDDALDAYIDTLDHPSDAVAIDDGSEPNWSKAHDKKLSKNTSGDSIVLGGDVVAVTSSERSAIVALVAHDARFPATLLDVAREQRTTGGSAGFRRYWIFTEASDGTRDLIELKELGVPGTEFGRHDSTLDGSNRFDVLKNFWWGDDPSDDHFGVTLLGSRFLVRSETTHDTVDPTSLSSKKLSNLVQAEASLLAIAHHDALGKAKMSKLKDWLHDSAQTLVTRWRNAYQAAGGQ